MTIRRAVAGDAAKLALVGAATFLESFAFDHPGDDLVAHVATGHSESWYAQALARDDMALWIAEAAEGAPVGYAVLAPATLPGASPGDLELKRIYVLCPWQGGGRGRSLFAPLLTEAIARGAKRLLLAVYNRNDKALAFYGRLGFVEIGRTSFMVGGTAFEDLVLARPL